MPGCAHLPAHSLAPFRRIAQSTDRRAALPARAMDALPIMGKRIHTSARTSSVLTNPRGASMRVKFLLGVPLGATLPVICVASALAASLNLGSKRFTESYSRGEIVKQTAEAAGEATVVHQQGLGNTAIVLNALTSGNIDIDPEHTGTVAK